MNKLGVIGAGTVGTALSVRLSRKGYPIAAVYSRSRTSAQKLSDAVGGVRIYENSQGVADSCDLIFITTPDDAIPSVAERTAWYPGQSVVHCSGADSTAVLEPAKKMGAHTGGFHPLQTFAGLQRAIDNIPGSTFAIEAEEPLLSTLIEMAKALDCNWIKLGADDKVSYHTAAVMACNYLITLVKTATDLWQTFGVPREEAVRALLPLLKGTLNNIETLGIPACLTGPIARGDTGTVNMHLNNLRETAPALMSIYCELGLQTVPIALAKGRINEERAHELESILDEQKSKFEGEVYAGHAKK